MIEHTSSVTTKVQLHKQSGLGYGYGELLVSWDKPPQTEGHPPVLPTAFRCERRFTPSRIDGTDPFRELSMEVPASPLVGKLDSRRELGVMTMHVDPVSGVTCRVDGLDGRQIRNWERASQGTLEVTQELDRHWLRVFAGQLFATRNMRHEGAPVHHGNNHGGNTPKRFNTVLSGKALDGLKLAGSRRR